MKIELNDIEISILVDYLDKYSYLIRDNLKNLYEKNLLSESLIRVVENERKVVVDIIKKIKEGN